MSILEAMKRLTAGDKVTYEPTPGAKKEKNKGWEADVPVVKSEAGRQHFQRGGRKAQASDKVTYEPTPGAKKEKPAKWEADVPVVQTCNNLVDAARKLAAAKAKHLPKVKAQKPHKAKAPENAEPKRKKPTKASSIVEAMAALK